MVVPRERFRAAVARVRRGLLAGLPGMAAMAGMAPPGRTATQPERALEAGAAVAAALVLLYPAPDGAPLLPLTLRPRELPRHGGQVSLPGGRLDDGEAPEQAALRELREELGVRAAGIRVLGTLSPLYIAPSHFVLCPVVAAIARRPRFRPDPLEVAELIETPLDGFLGGRRHRRFARREGGGTQWVPYYPVRGHRVWGATAMVLAELAAVWAAG